MNQKFNISIFYVTRRTPETRQKAKEDIKTRSLSPDQELPQLFLCPEGTNTNRRVLIQFKVINGFEFPLQIAYIYRMSGMPNYMITIYKFDQ